MMAQMANRSSQDFALAAPPQGQGQPARQQSRLSATSSSSSLAPTSFGLADLRGNLDPAAEPSSGGQRGGADSGQGQGGTLVAATAGAGVVLTASGGGGEGSRWLQHPPDAMQLEEQETSPQVSFSPRVFVCFRFKVASDFKNRLID